MSTPSANRKGRSRSARPGTHTRGSRALAAFVEGLEDRRLLTITLTGLPSWVALGGSPMLNSSSVADPGDPASGAVEDLAIDPLNQDRMFAATVNGGIWRTTNGTRPFNGIDDDGVNGIDDPLEQPDWAPLTDSYPSLAFNGIAFDPLDPARNTIFAGTGSASSLSNYGGRPIGIFRTTDAGDTWGVTRLNPSGTEPQVRTIVPTSFDADPVAPGFQQVILVGTASAGQGMYRSTDAGQTYTQVAAASGLAAGAVTSIIADPNNGSRFFAGVVGQGVFRTDDGGGTWAPVNTNLAGLAASSAILLSAHPGGGSTVVHTLISGASPAAFITGDGGANWTGLAALPAGFSSTNSGLYTDMASDQLITDPTNSQIVYVAKGYGGSPIVMRYDPSGMGSWVLIDSAGAGGNTRPHVDSRDMQFATVGGVDVLIHANDGGLYFLSDPQDAAANRWTSLHGRGATGLNLFEYTNGAWDSQFDVASAGAQDNGTSVQNAAGDVIWAQYRGADGGDVAIDTVNAGAGRVFRYGGDQNFNLTRYTFDSATNQPDAAVGLVPGGGLANFTNYFVPQWALNEVVPARLVTGGSGTSPVYELTNAATAPNAAGATWVAVPVDAAFGNVNDNNHTTFAVGGRLGGVDNPEVLVVPSGSLLFVRSTAGGTLTRTPTDFPGGTIQDVVLDPENWRRMFVADASGVWETTDAGSTWTDRTGNLAAVNARLRSISFVPSASGGTILVGGNLGVSRLSPGAADAVWTRLGVGLPNALVNELEYNAADDLLLATTFGRGAWTVDNASAVVTSPGVLQIDGDTDFPGQDDLIRLVRNALNPLILDVFLNSIAPVFSVALAALQQINVNGLGGNDRLVVDSSNGLVSVPNGLRYDGGTGFDTYVSAQTGGPQLSGEFVGVGANPGAGTHTLRPATGADQNVFFQNLEPLFLNAPSPELNIGAGVVPPGLASLLQASNAINYGIGSSDTDPLVANPAWGRVTIDAFEPINFQNKVVLVVDGLSGSDSFNLNNGSTPTGLATIDIRGGDPPADTDTLIVRANTAGDLALDFAARTIAGAEPVAVLYTEIERLSVDAAGQDLTLSGASSYAVNFDGITDSGSVDTNFIPLSFRQLGALNELTLLGGDGVDSVIINGSLGDDSFAVAATTGEVTVRTSAIQRARVVPTAIENLFLYGRAGSDTIDLASPLPYTLVTAEGGTGQDLLVFSGAAGAPNAFALERDGSRLSLSRNGTREVDGADIEHISLVGGTGPDSFTVGDLAGTPVALVDLAISATFANTATITGTALPDQVAITGVPDVPGGSVGTATVSGLAATVRIFGTGVSGANFDRLTILGLAGNDTIKAAIGTENIVGITLDGGEGDDLLSADATLLGGLGDDLLVGGLGNDSLDGGAGNDTLFGHEGDDTLIGGDGNDEFHGGIGANTFIGGAGFDTWLINSFTSDGPDTVGISETAPGVFEWTGTGGSATNTLTGIDEIRVETAGGDDVITANNLSIRTVVDAGAGNDFVDLDAGSPAVGATPAGAIILGGDGDDTLFGSSAADRIEAGSGNDLIVGNAGNDSLIGGDGSDAFIWDAADNDGNDLVEGGSGQDSQILTGLPSSSNNFTLAPLDSDPIRALASWNDFAAASGSTNLASVESVSLVGGTAADLFTVRSLVGTNVVNVEIDHGIAGVQDITRVFGSDGADNATISKPGTNQVRVNGLSATVRISNAEALDVLNVLLGVGDDRLSAATQPDDPLVTSVIGMQLEGGQGNDRIEVTGSDTGLPIDPPATLLGGQGDDTLIGADANDIILGGAGRDFMAGGRGNDFILGDGTGSGVGSSPPLATPFAIAPTNVPTGDDDTLFGDAGNDTINGGLGNDQVFGDEGDDLLGALPATAYDEPGNDSITGGLGNDTIFAGDGDDVGLGGPGSDTINGGLGNDLLHGDSDSAGIGPDFAPLPADPAGGAADLINGDDGNDTINGGAGNDTLNGGLGDDILGIAADFVDLPFDGVYLEPGDDLISGGDGNDSISAGTGNDTVSGGLGADSILGGDGNDSITGEEGADFIDAGAGDDTASGGPGNDTILGGAGDDLIDGGEGADSILGGDGNDAITGSAGNDTILGGLGNDAINAGDGDDLVFGEDGDDAIQGGLGNDSIDGGAGNDFILAQAGDDYADGGLGNDTVQGNEGNDFIAGNDGDDLITGGLGNDTLSGGDGRDRICGGLADGEAGDPLADGNDLIDGGADDDAIVGDAGNDTIYGSGGNDQLWGSTGDDSILGGFGADSIVGGEGNDFLFGEAGDDVMFGQAGNDTLWGGDDNDLMYGGEGDDTMLGGTPLTANAVHQPRDPSLPSDGDDTMLGGNGFDQVDGGNGNNLMDAGNDGIRETVLGGVGNDTIFSHLALGRSQADTPALDGGYNRDYHRGELVEPPIPMEQCEFVVFAIPASAYTGQKTLHDGSIVEHPPLSSLRGARPGRTVAIRNVKFAPTAKQAATPAPFRARASLVKAVSPARKAPRA